MVYKLTEIYVNTPAFSVKNYNFAVMKLLKTVILYIMIMPGLIASAQDSTHVAYSFNYKFTDGIYLNFGQFRNNRPLAPESVVFDNPTGKFSNVYDYIENTKEIDFFDENGNLTSIVVSGIWGYCKNGKPYVYYSNAFRQIPFIGSLCHFVATITVFYDNNPNLYYDPYYYNTTPNRYYSTEVVQLIIDMNSGNILNFDEENV
ncbi:MAG TPA: hypothetical protein PLM49_06055, partial [Bacteroidales bacterium]|nr:hypothetical protein [Bacteroidales bacterium]